MSQESTRRNFLKQMLASAAVLSGFNAVDNSHLLAQEVNQGWKNLPKLDGPLLLDEAPRKQMATDFGAQVHRLPAAVLKPRSVKDVVKIVRFANNHRLKIAMRGQGHSVYGQALVEGGIVVDSSTLNEVRLGGAVTAYAQTGASWNDVTRVTLAQGLTPPAMGDTMTLTVGGILSAGGVSNSSHLFGAVVDNVEELNVVTGEGDLVKCSPQRNTELFQLALGGMGQCGLIVSARLRLVAAPKWVARRDLDYDDLKTFLSDLRRLAAEAKVEHLGAYVLRGESSRRWRFRISIGKFCASPEGVDFGAVMGGLRFKSREDLVPVTYSDYLQREVARNAAVKAAFERMPSHRPYITMIVPSSASEEFIARILTTPPETAGMTRFSLYVLPTHKFARPLFVLPREEFALAIFLFRGVPVADGGLYSKTVATIRGLVEKTRAVGGKVYPPHAPFYTRSDWEAHYGPTKWHRLVAGKKRFDPVGILTPGTGMFPA